MFNKAPYNRAAYNGLAGGKTFVSNLTAALSFTGAIGRGTSKGIASTLSFTGAVSKQTARSLAAAVSFAGAVAKTAIKSLAGGLGFAGIIERHIAPIFNSLVNRMIDTSNTPVTFTEDTTQTVETGDTIENINTPNATGSLEE